MIGAIFFFTSAKQFQRTRSLRMRTCDQDRAKETHRRDVRTAEGRARNGSNAAVIANAGNGRNFAVGDAKRCHAEFFRAKSGFHRVAKALPEANGYEKIAPSEASDAPLHISCAADGSLRIESERHHPVAQMPTQAGRQIDSHNERSACSTDLPGQRDDFFGLEGRLQCLQVAKIHFHAVTNAIGNSAFFF